MLRKGPPRSSSSERPSTTILLLSPLSLSLSHSLSLGCAEWRRSGEEEGREREEGGSIVEELSGAEAAETRVEEEENARL